MNRVSLMLYLMISLLFLFGCGHITAPINTETRQQATTVTQTVSPDKLQIVDYNISTKKPIVVIKNASNAYLKDVKVKLTAKDENGNVMAVYDGNFGITSEIALGPNQQFALELSLGNGEIPKNAKLTWAIEPVVTNKTLPKFSIINPKMSSDKSEPLITGEFKNESSDTISGELQFDLYKGGKIIATRNALYAGTYDMPPGKVIAFAEKMYFLPDDPDSYEIRWIYWGKK